MERFEIEIPESGVEYMDSEKRISYLGYKEFEKNILRTYLEHGYDLLDEKLYETRTCNTRKYTFGKVKNGVWNTYYVKIKVIKTDVK